MGLQEWIDDAQASCTRGKTLLGYEADIWTRDLSSEEADILCAAAETGAIRLRGDIEYLFPALLSGGLPVFERQSDFDRSNQWNAFTSLCVRGVVDPLENATFRISEAALTKGKQIRAQRVCPGSMPQPIAIPILTFFTYPSKNAASQDT